MLKIELTPNLRLGTEMAQHARFWGRVGGIFHTDELPAYGISSKEVARIRELMGARDEDAVVLVADTVENAEDALKAVTERAREALKGVSEETRGANPDGTTQFMRPRPGAARMYPETDVPPVQISEDYLQMLCSKLPELPEQKMARFIKEYGLNQKLAKQVLDSEHVQLFETIAKQTKVSPTVIAVALTETLKGLKREGIEVENVADEQILELFSLIDNGKTVKEAIPDVVSWLAKHEKASVKDAVDNLGLTILPDAPLEAIIDELLRENKSLREKSGKEAFGVLMGLTMKKLRGKANPEKVAQILKKKLG
jgi:glutamyl-tRNA(Gln) amidotransferase subunit E